MKKIFTILLFPVILISCGNTQESVEKNDAESDEITYQDNYKGERPNDAYITVFAQ